MSEELMNILAECTEAIEQGTLTVEECLGRYPQYQAELADLLLVAMRTRAVPTAFPTPAFRQEARERLKRQLPPRTATANGGLVRSHSPLTAATPVAAEQSLTLREKLAQWWPYSPRPSLAVGAALLIVSVFLFSLWWPADNPLPDEAQLVENNPPARSEDGGVEISPSRDETADDVPKEIVAVPAPEHPFTAFIPAISDPLLLNPATAAVKVSRGVVELGNPDGEWVAVKEVTTAKAGQWVRTGPFSGATITFHDGSYVSLGPDSEISLDQVDAQRPAQGFRTVVMTQWLGESEHNVEFRNDAGSRYEVLTPNGSGQARGTTFQVRVTPDLLSHYTVTEGRVDVSNLDVTVVLLAGQTSVIPVAEPPSQPHFVVSGEGEVTAMGETWTIGGQQFMTNDSTVIVGTPQIGDIVSVSGYMLPDGSMMATSITLRHHAVANQFLFNGVVDSITAGEWIVSGQAIAVNETTLIDEAAAVGDTVRVSGVILEDGTFLAEQIDLPGDDHPFEFVGVATSITANSWIISGVTVTVDGQTEIQGEIAVGDVVKVEGLILADGTWLADEIKPAADDAKFELSGLVDSIDPWMVAGVTFATDTFTEIDNGIVSGDLVYVEGQILADGSWLATEIRLLAEDGLSFTLIGTVEQIDPWIVGGIAVAVDAATVIDAGVAVDMLVRVQGTIQPDGTWLASVIERLDDETENSGCFTVTASVISISGDQVILQGMPPVTVDEATTTDGEIAPNSIIMITACVEQDGTIIIVSIVVIHSAPPPPPPVDDGDDGDDGDDDAAGQQVTICHIPPGNPDNRHTITVGRSAWENGHRGHGDTLGPCP